MTRLDDNMKYSKLFTKTQKKSKEYDSVNATYLIKGGFIDQTMAGVYSFLPLGLRVLNKIENIVREEMDKIGVEMLMSALSPKSLWKKTGRFDNVDVLFKAVGANQVSKEKNDSEYVLNCTQEELITPIAQKFNLSYKDLPAAAYQIQSKFRNEARAKSGIMRGREFRMKDLYSFHGSEEDLLDYYHNEAKPAYVEIFKRLGLSEDTVIALASGGDFTKAYSHEFQTKCDNGEDIIFYDKKEDVYYNREVTASQAPKWFDENEEEKPSEDMFGEGLIGVAELAKFLKIEEKRTTKTILFENENGDVIAAAIQGNYEVDTNKLLKVADCKKLVLASFETVKRVTGAEIGYAGVLNLPEEVKVYFDDSMKGRKNFETGGNRTNYHTINVNFGRDLPMPEQFYDFKVAQEGDINPNTGEVYEVFKASEVGNIFPLNTKFSKAFNYTYTNEKGEKKLVYMGSYGIGTSRIMGVIVEKFHDDRGILWPESVAPFSVHLVNIGMQNTECRMLGEELYQQLLDHNIEVLYDERENVAAGAKFGDADLIGCPVRLVISPRNGDKVEWKRRGENESEMLEIEEVIKRLK